MEIPEIKFDRKGNVMGEYYGKCPLCKEKNNLVHQNNKTWCCYKCKFKKLEESN